MGRRVGIKGGGGGGTLEGRERLYVVQNLP